MANKTAWLIELKDTSKGVQYLTLRPKISGFWTTDANEALRFCRKQDADDYVNYWDGEEVSHAVEHMWCDPPAKSAHSVSQHGEA